MRIPASPDSKRPTCRILSLDGGGTKGFYTLGVLQELEAWGGPLHQQFDFVCGTSTGAFTAALIGLGLEVGEIGAFYQEWIPIVLHPLRPHEKSVALQRMCAEAFGDRRSDAFLTRIGILATDWEREIAEFFLFTDNLTGESGSPPWPIASVVAASCSAYPLFAPFRYEAGETCLTLVDGSYCANNPVLFAIGSALQWPGTNRERLRVVSVGTGDFPATKAGRLEPVVQKIETILPLQKTLRIGTHCTEILRQSLLSDIPGIRISRRFTEEEMATSFVDVRRATMDRLFDEGRVSGRKEKASIERLLELNRGERQEVRTL